MNHVGPVFWKHGEDGGTMVLTPLAATRHDADGELEWCNVLGPVFHYTKTSDGGSFVAVTPLLMVKSGKEESGWSVWPFVSRDVSRHPDGSRKWATTSALGRLMNFEGETGVDRGRFFPFLAYISPLFEGSLELPTVRFHIAFALLRRKGAVNMNRRFQSH